MAEEQNPLTRALGRRLPCTRPTRQEVGPFRLEERELRKTGMSRGSAVEYQADVQAGVARLRWRVSGR